MADPIQLQFEFPDNTGPISSSWTGLASISKDMRASWDAINTGMQGTIEKAGELRAALNLENETFTGIRSVLEEISKSISANDQTLKNSLQTIGQIIAQSNNVGLALQRTEGFAAKGAPQSFANPLSTPQALAAYADQQRTIQTNPFYQKEGLDSPFVNVNETRPSAARQPRLAYDRTQPRGFEEGLSNVLGGVEEGTLPTGSVGGTAPGTKQLVNQWGQAIAPLNPAYDLGAAYQNLAPYWLSQRTGTSVLNKANISQAPYMAINGIANDIAQSSIGGIPGIGAIAQVIKSLGTTAMQTAGGFGTTNETTGMTSVQEQLLSAINSLKGSITSLGGGTVGQVLKGAGGIAAMGTGIYNTMADVASTINQGVYSPSQELADVTGGKVSPSAYGALYANAMKFAGNPQYTPQDYMAAQMAARQLGLNGSLASNYQNIDYGLQTQYGLGQQEVQNLMGTGLAYGINLNQFAGGYEQARTYANQVGNTSMAYTSQAYQTGAASAAAMGFNSKAATGMGQAAAAFGAGNQIAQNAGMTGQELMGTTLGTALFAQAAGVPFMSAYSAAQGMTSTQANATFNKSMIGLLQDLGIPVNSIKSINDLNPYAIKLGIILPELGINDANTPQAAVNWAWQVIQQSRGLTSAAASASTTSPQGVSSTSTLLSSSSADTSIFGTALGSAGFSSTQLGQASTTTANGVTVQISLAAGLQNVISATVANAASTTTSSTARLAQNSSS